ncbi:Atu4866 domain-containing protein [Oceanibaculum indicum]|uniref:Putative ligand-binding protein with streptavidin-like fold n=1 Tax=Oceanibaculum indicum TaxID=526216 RepID=A0A420WHM8_9PROT|nr:Atu4866 domain-containing protein [Oceanibaculum indicum]RKQ70524.1 putative ligand-binding protein with streptavidin-like fold [Oceanibaculum indicum]
MKTLPVSLLAAVLLAGAALLPIQKGHAQMNTQTTTNQPAAAQVAQDHPYVGMWVTPDGHIRHELLPNNRYVEARGSREKAYQGRYKVTGTHIDYWDDTGFTADGTFVDENTLHHGGMIFHRR